MSQHIHFVIDSFTSYRNTANFDNKQRKCNCPKCAANCECKSHCKSNSETQYDTLYITLPEVFTNSGNTHKTVQIYVVHLYDLETRCEIPYASMYSDLIQVNKSADNYCCACNIYHSTPKDFIIADSKSVFEVWFRDIGGEIIDLNPTKTRIIFEMLLTF